MKKEICIIVNGYPTKDDPVYTFIQPVARELADAGISCTVIAPQSLTKMAVAQKEKRPYRWTDKTEKGNEVVVYQPKYVSVSNVSVFGYNISTILRDASIKRCFFKEKMSPDVLYAHFWDCGIAACKLAEKTNTPVFVATGESEIRILKYCSLKSIDRYLPYVTGVIAVSTKNLEESRDMGLLKHSPKTIVLPNAVDFKEFYKVPKEEARSILRLSKEDTIALFVGSFCHRKGVLRVTEAVDSVDGVKLILIGNGEQSPNSEKILYNGRIPHDKIVMYLNAADMFVLPTLAEGCCNAIVEAMACGLPVISSNLPFNDDILDESCSIRIDPNNIVELSDAIALLKNDAELKEKLSEGALSKAKGLTIEQRVGSILRFINDDMKSNCNNAHSHARR